MKVKELIEQLKTFDPELSVFYDPYRLSCGCCYQGGHPEVESVQIQHFEKGNLDKIASLEDIQKALLNKPDHSYYLEQQEKWQEEKVFKGVYLE